MKRIIFLFVLLTGFVFPIFAQEENPDEDENIVRKEYDYATNGKGDQFLKIGIMASFPLNFGEQLYTGGAVQIGYYRFLNGWLALGGELMAGYNPTLGSNVLTYVPITFGVLFQPYVWKIEFPTTLSVGFGFETCQNKKYFPGFVAKAESGVFFRITEGWSMGLSAQMLYLPEWYTTTTNADSDYALFMQAALSARYHF